MLYLHGMGHFHPENEIDNAFLESLDIGTSDSWIMERVGIRTRRTVLNLDYLSQTKNADPRKAAKASQYTNAQTGANAARLALKRAGLEPQDIGMVIAGGCSPQYSIPAEACTIAAELGISAPCFDLNSACSSFAVQIHFLDMMRAEALPEYVLIINAENNTRTVNYTDRTTAVLWGDGTSAAIISARTPAQRRITYTLAGSDPSGWDKVVIPTGGHFSQTGSAVQSFAIKRSIEILGQLRNKVQSSPKNFFFIGHQANLLMLQSVCERAEIPEELHLCNVAEFGNCGAAGAPSVLSQNWDRLSAGDEVGLIAVGAGLTWGGIIIQVGPPL